MNFTYKDKDYFVNVHLVKNAKENINNLKINKVSEFENNLKIDTIEDTNLEVIIKVEKSLYSYYQIIFIFKNLDEPFSLPWKEYCSYDGTPYDDDILIETAKKFADDIERWGY